MKTKLFSLLSILAFAFTLSIPAPALAAGGKAVRVIYSSANVTTSAYTQLVSSTARGIKGISVVNSGSAPVQIAFGASGSEVVQAVFPNAALAAPAFIPLSAGYATRISVISLTQTNSTGELEVNLVYN